LPHLSAELFASMAGIKLTHVPYKGPAIAITDLISGYVQLYFMNVTQALPLVDAKKLRALGVTSPKRSVFAPTIPTIAESGATGYDMTNWYGMLVGATTPHVVIAKINAEVNAILKLSEAQRNLAVGGMSVEATSSEEFAEFLKRESSKYQRVIAASGILGAL
jgi:tripartite-type tricarboxylate transporter receptor subunit TctC